MQRDELISQVKNEYARLASEEAGMQQTTTGMTPEAFYEGLLGQVIEGISKGKFDRFDSGMEIVEAVANDKSLIEG